MIKKKRKSRDWYRFDEQIWCNFSRDKNLTKRHAIQGSMKNTRFSGGVEKGVKVSFSRGTNEFSSLPSWVRFNGIFFAWVKKKKPFKNLKTIPILIFYEYCLHLGLLWCQQYFRFWDCIFLHPMEEKNRSNHCSLPLSRVDRKKCTLPQIKKNHTPLVWGIFHQIWIWVEQPSLGLIQNHTRSPVQFCSFFGITKRLSLSAEL